MKIAVISPNPRHLADIEAALQARGHSVSVHEGGKSRMQDIAQAHLPQLLVVDGICRDPGELTFVEQVTSEHPQTAVILLCASHTPEFLINSMRAGVREVLPSPVTAAALEAAVDRVAAKLGGAPARREGRVLAFVSCKGGSGATFLAANLACQLAETKSVLLVDLNLQFGDALSYVHDGRPAATLADVAKDIARLDATLLAASCVKVAGGCSVLAAPEDLAHALEIKPEQVDSILALAAAQYDYVVLDVPRALDQVAIKALDRASHIFAVMQSALPDLRHAGRLLQAFRALGYPPDRTEVILNRCERSAEIDIDQVHRVLGPGVRLRTVPNAWKDASTSINHGDPLVASARSGVLARRLGELAASLAPASEAAPRSLIERIFRRA